MYSAHDAGAPQIEELAAAAVKEESIEAKLAALTAQWAVLSLTFQDYKTRGPVILKVQAVCMCGRVPAAQLHDCAKLAVHACLTIKVPIEAGTQIVYSSLAVGRSWQAAATHLPPDEAHLLGHCAAE